MGKVQHLPTDLLLQIHPTLFLHRVLRPVCLLFHIQFCFQKDWFVCIYKTFKTAKIQRSYSWMCARNTICSQSFWFFFVLLQQLPLTNRQAITQFQNILPPQLSFSSEHFTETFINMHKQLIWSVTY